MSRPADIDAARDALRRLLWELPAEFTQDPADTEARQSFRVIKPSNVRNVHEALWDLQQALDHSDTGVFPPEKS